MEQLGLTTDGDQAAGGNRCGEIVGGAKLAKSRQAANSVPVHRLTRRKAALCIQHNDWLGRLDGTLGHGGQAVSAAQAMEEFGGQIHGFEKEERGFGTMRQRTWQLPAGIQGALGGHGLAMCDHAG